MVDPDLENRFRSIERELRAWRLAAVALAGLGVTLSCGKHAADPPPRWPSVIQGSLTIEGADGTVTIDPGTITIRHGDAAALVTPTMVSMVGEDHTTASFGVTGAQIDSDQSSITLSPQSVLLQGPHGVASLEVQDAVVLTLDTRPVGSGTSAYLGTTAKQAELVLGHPGSHSYASLSAAKDEPVVEVSRDKDVARLAPAR
jgi:hypothetical protein